VAGSRAAGSDDNSVSERLCTCGHAEKAHLHYRRGTQCALCDCPRWSGNGPLRRLLRLRRSQRYRARRARTEAGWRRADT
jgi:hypothetical protein